MDKNAIKILGKINTGAYHLGYIPKELASQLVANGISDIFIRLSRVYLSRTDYFEIRCQLLGLKTQKKYLISAIGKHLACSLLGYHPNLLALA
jgi:hypothetical protein